MAGPGGLRHRGRARARAGATVSPGTAPNPYGTLHVSGGASFASGATFAVSINPAGQSSTLAVGGTATLGGAGVTVASASGTYDPATRFAILTRRAASRACSGRSRPPRPGVPEPLPKLRLEQGNPGVPQQRRHDRQRRAHPQPAVRGGRHPGARPELPRGAQPAGLVARSGAPRPGCPGGLDPRQRRDRDGPGCRSRADPAVRPALEYRRR